MNMNLQSEDKNQGGPRNQGFATKIFKKVLSSLRAVNYEVVEFRIVELRIF